MYKHIDLNYLIENSFNDANFIKDILETTSVEFKKLILELEKIDEIGNFSPGELFHLFHKYKPTVAMFGLKCYVQFRKYGNGDYRLSLEEFRAVKDGIVCNLKNALEEIEIELQKY